jgi:hypothetical protein
MPDLIAHAVRLATGWDEASRYWARCQWAACGVHWRFCADCGRHYLLVCWGAGDLCRYLKLPLRALLPAEREQLKALRSPFWQSCRYHCATCVAVEQQRRRDFAAAHVRRSC